MRDQHYEIEVSCAFDLPWKQIYSWVGKKYTIYSKVIIATYRSSAYFISILSWEHIGTTQAILITCYSCITLIAMNFG